MKILMAYYYNISQNQRTIKKIVKLEAIKLNDRPRKKLNYKIPAQLMAEHIVA